MNTSTRTCCNSQPLTKKVILAILLLYAALLHPQTKIPTQSTETKVRYSTLSSFLHFQDVQCPSFIRASEENAPSCSWDHPKYSQRAYNPNLSIFGNQPLRPFTPNQQLALLELLDIHGITSHQYSLHAIVYLTQNIYLSKLTPTQQKQARDWCEKEGDIVEEKACVNNNLCKKETTRVLKRMGFYASLVPKFQHYDYTLILGGSIQEMQWRTLIILSLFRTSLQGERIDLGNIVALTCDRTVARQETEESSYTTMFNVSLDPRNERARAPINNSGEDVILTETTAYQAIYYGLKRMAESPEYFNRFKETSFGYHPHLPVSFLSENSFESSLYRKNEFTYQLSPELPKILQAFFKRYPEASFFETSMSQEGENLIKRPTTKQTAKEWLLSKNNKPDCKDPNHCKILIISNAPNAYYQHVAVIQALEESLVTPTRFTYEAYTAASGASMDIPTNFVLDNLTKLLYLETFHPKR